MKLRGLLAVLAIAAVGFSAPAARADNNVGCGLGTQLLEGQEGLFMQLLATITNQFIGTQTFGISSNTLGCVRNATITAEYRTNMFAGANLHRLARDMAVGGGESLETLAVLMEIEEADRPAFYTLTKQNFVTIFPAGDVTAGDMLTNLDRLMAEDAQLARYVQS